MTDVAAADVRWLDMAARLATSALGTTGSSPTVGALVVDPSRNIVHGRAVTPPRGQGHAELLALAAATETRGCTLHVTLEPDATIAGVIANASIDRVVTGAVHPDPALAGEGLRALVEIGIEATHVPHLASTRLNEGFATRITTGRPFVTLKIALTHSGMVGHARRGMPSPLGVEAQRWLERERAAADAILSGAARAEIEDNDLRVHLHGLTNRTPLRVVLGGSGDLDLSTELFSTVTGAPVMVVTTPDRPMSLGTGIEVAAVEGQRGHPEIRRVLALLGERGINRLLVEAGARVADTFISSGLVDRLHVVDVAAEIGRDGVPAALYGRLEDRIGAAGLSEVDRRALGEDKVRTLERDPVISLV